jgi:Domain of unknown function (DUF4326)
MKINIRNKKTYKGKGEYIGRPSPLGNPFGINDKIDRHTSIQLYYDYITICIKHKDSLIINELDRLFKILVDKQELTLICFCKPKECHGDVIEQLLVNKIYSNNYLGFYNKIGLLKYEKLLVEDIVYNNHH